MGLKFRNQRVENFFLQIGFDDEVHKHKYLNDLGVNIVEDLKLLEEYDWDTIIDKRDFGTQKLIQQSKLKRDWDVLNDTRNMNINLVSPILIKDNISEKSNDIKKIIKKKRKKKLSPTMGGDLVSISKYYPELEGQKRNDPIVIDLSQN